MLPLYPFNVTVCVSCRRGRTLIACAGNNLLKLQGTRARARDASEPRWFLFFWIFSSHPFGVVT